jgi:hypothetical protein
MSPEQELTVAEQIKTWLFYYGIPADYPIEKEAEEHLLMAISRKDVTGIKIQDGGLVVEFEDDGRLDTQMDEIPDGNENSMNWDDVPSGNENSVDWSSLPNEEVQSESKPAAAPKVLWDDIPSGNGNRI